jgi:hypothetical protein
MSCISDNELADIAIALTFRCLSLAGPTRFLLRARVCLVSVDAFTYSNRSSLMRARARARAGGRELKLIFRSAATCARGCGDLSDGFRYRFTCACVFHSSRPVFCEASALCCKIAR